MFSCRVSPRPGARSLVRLLTLAVLVLAAGPVASASAIVGGERVTEGSVPWFAKTGICGGALIAPDRVVTAAHCVDPIDMADLEAIEVGGQKRRGVRVSLPPAWRTQRVGFALHDIAIVQLDRPITSVRPVELAAPGSTPPAKVTIIGRGQINAPARGKTALPGLFPLRRAVLETVGDARCGRLWKRSGTKYRARFAAQSDVCATDADGGRPRDSVCAGDSGGPMIAGTTARPVLVGVISWTGPRCGADKLPSVAVDTALFHAFLTAAAPTWAPVAAGALQVAGRPAVGETLTCAMPAWEVAPDRLDVRWVRRVTAKDGRYRLVKVAEAETYTVAGRDAGKLVACEALASNAGGRTLVPLGMNPAVRIPG